MLGKILSAKSAEPRAYSVLVIRSKQKHLTVVIRPERVSRKSGTGKEGKPILGSIIQITVVQSGGYIPPEKRKNGHPKDGRLEYLSITFFPP